MTYFCSWGPCFPPQWLAPPPAEMVVRALEVLYSLGALDDDARLTRPTGVMLADLPLEPMLGKALLCSGCDILCIFARRTRVALSRFAAGNTRFGNGRLRGLLRFAHRREMGCSEEMLTVAASLQARPSCRPSLRLSDRDCPC